MHRAWFLLLVASCGGDPPPHPFPPSSTTLVVHVTADGQPVPARMQLYDSSGAPLRIGTLDMYQGTVQDRGYCALADGAIGTWQGIALAYGDAEIPIGVSICDAAIPIPFGHYHARVMRGGEYEFFEADLDLTEKRGKVMLDAPLGRAFTTDGTLAADLHVHAENSGDSTLPRSVRVVTEAAAGIQVIGSSDHNYDGDYQAEIAALSMQPFVASLGGDEISIDIGHFNAFPMDPAQPQKLGTYDQIRGWSARTLIDTVHGLPGRPFLFINHPRLGFAAYFDLAVGTGVPLTWPPPMPVDFDGLEVLTGWTAYNDANDRRLDLCVADFYTLIGHGQLLTALGNSDTHHLNNILAGFPRTYVKVVDPRLDPFDSQGFVDALRARHAVATTGPWLWATVGAAGPGDTAQVSGAATLHVDVRQASYVHATRLRVLVGGQVVATPAISGTQVLDVPIDVGSTDTWIGVDVAGDDPLPPDLVGDYLTAAANPRHAGMLPFAIINPILVDANGDGQVTLRRPLALVPDFRAPAVIPHAERGPYDCGEPVRK